MDYMRLALRLARKGYGTTSPNPMVGAVLVKRGRIIGQGWHKRAGGPHAEIEALSDAKRRHENVGGATMFITLEPCCTEGRTPPCTDAIIAAGIKRVVVGATDPNPKHSGRAFELLRSRGIEVASDPLASQCSSLNRAFDHWIVNGSPLVTVKAAMTLDGKIATAAGESKWITGEAARNYSMRLRFGADAILVGVNTILADNPHLTIRSPLRIRGSSGPKSSVSHSLSGTLSETGPFPTKVSDEVCQARGVGSRGGNLSGNELQDARWTKCGRQSAEDKVLDRGVSLELFDKPWRRIVLDSNARTPLDSNVLTSEPQLTTIVVSENARATRRAALEKHARVIASPKPKAVGPSTVPSTEPGINLPWLLRQLGAENVTHLLVEGGGEVNASFLLGGLAHTVAFFYAPMILGGRHSRRAVAGLGAGSEAEALRLNNFRWRRLGPDWLLTADINAKLILPSNSFKPI